MGCLIHFYKRLDSWPRFVSPDLKMRYVAAALLAALGGGEPSAANIKKILSSVGVDAGKDNLGTMPAAGAAPAAAAAPAGGAAAPAAAKKEEEPEEEEDDDMGFGLFD